MPAGGGLARAQLPPLHLEQCALPPARLEVREPLPNQVLDVVLEEQYGNGARLRHVHGRKKKIGDAQVEVALRQHLARRAPNAANAPLPEIDGVVGEPGAGNGRRDHGQHQQGPFALVGHPTQPEDDRQVHGHHDSGEPRERDRLGTAYGTEMTRSQWASCCFRPSGSSP